MQMMVSDTVVLSDDAYHSIDVMNDVINGTTILISTDA